MIAAGISNESQTVSVVTFKVTPRGIEDVTSQTMPRQSLKASSVHADVIGCDGWNIPECLLAHKVIGLSMRKSRREPLLERFAKLAHPALAGVPREAAINALVAAFGEDW